MKLMLAFGLASHWQAVTSVAIFSIVWGALFGVIRALLDGQLLHLLKNTLRLTSGKLKADSPELHHIPYTVALAFAWLSHLFSRGGLL